MNVISKITAEQVKDLISSNHVVMAYPRKNIIVVDGFKRYNATDAVCKLVKELNK